MWNWNQLCVLAKIVYWSFWIVKVVITFDCGWFWCFLLVRYLIQNLIFRTNPQTTWKYAILVALLSMLFGINKVANWSEYKFVVYILYKYYIKHFFCIALFYQIFSSIFFNHRVTRSICCISLCFSVISVVNYFRWLFYQNPIIIWTTWQWKKNSHLIAIVSKSCNTQNLKRKRIQKNHGKW